MNLSRNVIIHFFGKLIPAFSSLVIMIAGIRILGKAEFGKYNLMFSAAVIISSLFIGWIQQSTLRFLSGAKAEDNFESFKYANLGIWASAATGIITALTGIYYFQLSFIDLSYYVGFTILFALLSVHLTIFQACFRALKYAVTESLFYFLTIVFSVVLLLYFGQVDFIVFFTAMFWALLIVFATLFFTQKKGVSKREIVRESNKTGFFKHTFKFGFPLTVWILISSLLNYIDRFIINHYEGYEAVGIYSSVYDFIYKVGGFLSLPILLAYHPAISNTWSGNDYKKGNLLIKKAVKSELIILAFIFIVLFIIHKWVFETIFHLNEVSTTYIFIPLAISSMLWQMSLLIQKPLEFNIRRKTMIGGIIISVMLNFILNIILIPRFGYVVASYNTLASTLFYFIFVVRTSSAELKKVTKEGH